MKVRSLAWEDLLEEASATHSSMLAWRIPWTEEHGSYHPRGHSELNMTEATYHTCTILVEVETVTDFIFLGSKTLWMVTAAKKLKGSCSLGGKL